MDLLATLAIAGALAGAAIPAMTGFYRHHESIAAVNRIVGAVQMTRQAAATQGLTATLCPVAGNRECGGRHDWHHGMLIFADRNSNGRIDADDHVLRRIPAFPQGARVYWRSFGNRNYLRFNSRGLTIWQNGNFLYCAPNGEPSLARSVIINLPGRARRARDTDADGIVEDARGRPVACPPVSS